MAYSIEDRDIVLKGFEEGIFDDPYKGIYDMRCVDVVSIPGEASVAMKTQVTAQQNSANFSDETVTCNYTTNVITHDGSNVLTVGQVIYFYPGTTGKKVFGGLTAGRAYFVKTVPTPTTFTVSLTNGGAEVDLKDPADNARINAPASGSGTISAVTSRVITITALTDPTRVGYMTFISIRTTVGYPNATPSGWTILSQKTLGTEYFTTFYRVITGTEGSNDVTVTWGSAVTGKYNYNVFKHDLYTTMSAPLQTSDVAYTTSNTSAIAAGLTTTGSRKNAFMWLETFASDASADGSLWTRSALGSNSWNHQTDDTGVKAFSWDYIVNTSSGATGDITTTLNVTTTAKHSILYEFAGWDDSDVKMGTINIAEPKQLYTGLTTLNEYMYFCLDVNGRLWVYDNDTTYMSNTSTWLYMNNKSDETASATAGVAVWKGYVFVFDSSGVNYTQLTTYSTMFSGWVYNWKSALTSGVDHDALIAQDDTIYFCNGNFIGRLFEEDGFTFNPATAGTYNYEAQALPILADDRATCLAELGSELLIGGSNNFVYPWDRVSNAYNPVIRLSENYISKIVTINTTAYIFAGYKGRIFMTNGSNATPFYKIPEYLSGVVNPYFIWKDATYNNNQLYFSFTCTTNAGTAVNEYGGVWAVNVDSSTPSYPRLQNKLSYGTYAGSPTCFTQDRGTDFASSPSNNGYGLFIGWSDGVGGYGIDKTIATPYTGGESYIIFDPIPVGTFKTKRTFENLEYKVSAPLVTNESVALYYRTDLTSAFTAVPVTSGNSAGDVSGLADTVNFENAQWIQIKVVLTGTATNPSYVRLREARLR